MENQEALAAEQSRRPYTTGSAHDVLVAARKLIEKPENWARNGGQDGRNNRCCVTTAVCRVAGGYTNGKLALTAFRDANNIRGSILGDVWSWNDAPEREHAEVLAAFDKAIELARAAS